jgi:hypothetical protein
MPHAGCSSILWPGNAGDNGKAGGDGDVMLQFKKN